jgi:hypothetical protein
MSTTSPLLTATILALSLIVSGVSAIAADSPGAEARYQSERAVCLSGKSNQDRTTCLKEAGAARDEAKRNQLGAGQSSFQSNAAARCSALPGDDKRDCESRVQGEGSISGSVRDGGVMRETTTITVPDNPPK